MYAIDTEKPSAALEGAVDLRSDTLTRPTPAMRRAMAEAEVGDDVYREDPTVNALEERVAGLFGPEAGLFVPSGTMGNQIGLRLVCEPGQEVLCDADAHILTYEMGAAAALFGISSRTVVSGNGGGGFVDAGRVSADQLIAQVRPKNDWHLTPTAAIAVENTHNRGGGLVQPLDELQKLWDWSRTAGVAVHLDGARLFNAAVATGKDLTGAGGGGGQQPGPPIRVLVVDDHPLVRSSLAARLGDEDDLTVVGEC